MSGLRTSGVLGIVGCEVLTDEMVHSISNEKSLKAVLIVETPEGSQAYGKLRAVAPDMKVQLSGEGELWSNIPVERPSAVLMVMPISLHQAPSELREKVMFKLLELSGLCESIVVFYGLCGNAFREIDRLTSGLRVPVTILRDDKARIVDDCIGATLGGTEEYLSYLREEKGEYPLNTMWALRWRHYMHETQLLRDPDDLEEARMVFRCMGYSVVTMLDTGLGDSNEYEREVKGFADLFGLRIRRIPCRTRVADNAFHKAVEMLLEPNRLAPV
jgi:hypothetical protein